MRSKIRNDLYEEWINKQVISLLDQLRNKNPKDSKLLTLTDEPIKVSNELDLLPNKNDE